MHPGVCWDATEDKNEALHHVANAVFHSLKHTNKDLSSSQKIPVDVVESYRKQYLTAIQKNNIDEFLKDQYQLFRCMLNNAQHSSHTISIYYEENRQTHFETLQFHKGFHTIGRLGDVCVPVSANNVSRYHAVLFHITYENSKRAIVIMDWWSKFGTAIAGTTHASLPNDRRILIVPGDQPFVLQLGILNIEPFMITINVKRCLICQDSPRTELFETCNHLVSCRACFLKLMACKGNTTCPICRQPVFARCTRTAQIEHGEYQTCITAFDKHSMEEQMDALQSTLLKKTDL